MANEIQIKRSSVPGKVPLETDLPVGGLAINLADKKLYSKDAGGAVIELGGSGGSVYTKSSTPPSTPNEFDRWLDTDTGKEYTYIVDVDSSQWVETGTAGVLLDEGFTGTNPTVDSLLLNTASAESGAVGKLVWNADEGTADLGLAGGNSTLQLGQELMVRIRNNSGYTINNGTAVRFTGTIGSSGRITVAPMIANGTVPPMHFLGVTTETIANGADGFCTVFGKVRGLDTSSFAEGAILYCDPASPGGLTSTEPSAPNLKIPVAAVVTAHTNGTLMVRAAQGYRIQDLHDVNINGGASTGDVLTFDGTKWHPDAAPTDPGTQKLHGFPNRVDSTLTYDSATRTATLSQTGGIKYWYKGTLVTRASPLTLQHDAAVGGYFLYFADTSGTLTASNTPWDLEQHVPLVYIYYEGTKGNAWEERHAAQRDPLIHKYLHSTQGTKKVSGFAISGYTLENGTANSMVQYAVASGVVSDEDIQVTTSALTGGGTYSTWYRAVGGTNWTWATHTTVPYKVGTTYPQYDNAGTLTELASGELVNYWIMGSTSLDPANQIFSIMGQRKHTSIGDALYEGFDDLTFPSFPILECVPLYRVTYIANSTYATTGKCAILYVTPITREFTPERQTTDYLDLLEKGTAPTPSSGHMRLFAKRLGAGRVLPAAVGPSGMDYTLQPAMFRQKVGFWNPQGNATTVPAVFGFTAFTAVGTATARTVATTNLMTRMRRLGYVTAATTAGTLVSVRTAAAQYAVGNGSGLGGFFYSIRFARSDAAAVSGVRFFAGLSATTTAPTNVEPSTLVNCIGIAQLSTASDRLYLVYGGSAAQAAIDLGTGFPPYNGTVGVTTGVPYDFQIFCPPNENGVVYWQLDRLDTGTTTSGKIVPTVVGTQTPNNTTLLNPVVWACNNATALACAFDLIHVYIETDY